MASVPAAAATTTAAPVAAQPTRERISLTLQQRRALRGWALSQPIRPSHKECIDWFRLEYGHSISQSTVSHSLSSKYTRLDGAGPQLAGSRLRFGNWPDVERLVLAWYQQAEAASGRPPTNEEVADQARLVFASLPQYQAEPNTPEFSSGWIHRFKRRYGLLLAGRRTSQTPRANPPQPANPSQPPANPVMATAATTATAGAPAGDDGDDDSNDDDGRSDGRSLDNNDPDMITNLAEDVPGLVDLVRRSMPVSAATSAVAVRDALLSLVNVQVGLDTCAVVRSELLRQLGARPGAPDHGNAAAGMYGRGQASPMSLDPTLSAGVHHHLGGLSQQQQHQDQQHQDQQHQGQQQQRRAGGDVGDGQGGQDEDAAALSALASGLASPYDRPEQCPFCSDRPTLLRTVREAVEHMSTHIAA